MTKREYVKELQERLLKQDDMTLDYLQRLTTATYCLNRIKQCYPAVFRECVMDEDIERIAEGLKKE